MIDSRGGVFYMQKRVGAGGKDFRMIKFRTMVKNAEKKGLLTIGFHDSRITKVGYFLRKHKLDELPQLINVLIGEMSFVGPRPEVRKYVDLYTAEQRQVLTVRPGITDIASIAYFDENETLKESDDPEKKYIEQVMPHKLALNIKYLNDRSFFKDVDIILKTIGRIFIRKHP
jgi:lipopolysaccharide/colanic/teichoic acid biosynthesis glycosyltransferase